MKKYVKIGIILIIILSLLIPFTIVNATTENETEDVEFLTATSEQITLSDKIELVVNIENISYTNFTLTLTSEDLDFSSLKISSDEDDDEDNGESNELGEVESEVETTEEENTLVITISNSTLNKIVIQIDLPDGVTVGDSYEIVGSVVNNDDTESIENTVEITIIESTTDENEEEESSESLSETIQNNQNEENIVENTEESLENMNLDSSFDNSNENMNLENDVSSDFANQESGENSNDMSNMATNNTSSLSMVTSAISTEDTITYNGSDNNYLSELSIDGYELNKTFLKESQTYFVTIGSDVDSLTINATAEDDDATVHIYGNTSLQTGENKVLISVYAENGNERVYKIIVTKEAE